MGLEYDKEGIKISDILGILKGHMPDRYQVNRIEKMQRVLEFSSLFFCAKQFQPPSLMSSRTPGFVKSQTLKDKIHCVAYVIEASSVNSIPWQLERKLKSIRKTINNLGLNKHFFKFFF